MVEQFEEAPGSRTVQPTQVQPGKADEIAYRDLKPGEVIQAGDEWKQMEAGRACWQGYHSDMIGKTLSEFCYGKARRPYNITQMNAAIATQTEVLAEVRADEKRLCMDLELLRSEYVALQQRHDQAAGDRMKLREALTTEQEAHRVTIAKRLQACKERDEAEQALKMSRLTLEELQRRLDAAVLEELQWRLKAAGSDTPAVAEVVENILSALEIASHALEYLADVGVHEEAGHYSGFSAAVAVVRKIREAAK